MSGPRALQKCYMKEKKKKKNINIYIAQIPCEYVQMCVTNKYERAN